MRKHILLPFFVVTCILSSFSHAYDKLIPIAVDDLSFTNTLYTSEQIDTIVSNIPGGGSGSGFPLTNNADFANYGASNVSYISLSYSANEKPSKSFALSEDGKLLFDGNEIGSGGSGSINFWGPTSETNQQEYVTNSLSTIGIIASSNKPNMTVVFDSARNAYVLKAVSAIPGPQGADGVGNIEWAGGFREGMYITNDNTWVSYDGSVWSHSATPDPVITPPSINAPEWQLVIAKGEAGGTIDGAYSTDLTFVEWTTNLIHVTTNNLVSYGGYLSRPTHEMSDNPVPRPVNYGIFNTNDYVIIVPPGPAGGEINVYSNMTFIRYFNPEEAIPAHSLVVYQNDGYLWYRNTDYIPGVDSPPSQGDPNWQIIGKQGERGPAGANGIGNLIYKGHWDSYAQYNENEIVGRARPDDRINWYRAKDLVPIGTDPYYDISETYWSKEITSGTDANKIDWKVVFGNYDSSIAHSNELYRYVNGIVYYTDGVVPAGEGNAPIPNNSQKWKLFVKDGTSVASNVVWRGTYAPGQEYIQGDMVTYSYGGASSLYICKSNYPAGTEAGAITPGNATYWTAVATGLQGPQGPKGENGTATYITNIVNVISDHVDNYTNIYETNIIHQYSTNITYVTNYVMSNTVFVTNYNTTAILPDPESTSAIPSVLFNTNQFAYNPQTTTFSLTESALGVTSLQVGNSSLLGAITFSAGTNITFDVDSQTKNITIHAVPTNDFESLTLNGVTITSWPDSGVSSLNNLTGDVNIYGESNITARIDGNSIYMGFTNNFVESFNTLTGNVAIKAGQNIILNTNDDNTISITALGGGSGEVVSLNGLVGTLQLVGQDGVSISTSGSTNIVISAEGGGSGGSTGKMLYLTNDYTMVASTNEYSAFGIDTSVSNVTLTLTPQSKYQKVSVTKFSNLNWAYIIGAFTNILTYDGQTITLEYWPEQTNWYWSQDEGVGPGGSSFALNGITQAATLLAGENVSITTNLNTLMISFTGSRGFDGDSLLELDTNDNLQQNTSRGTDGEVSYSWNPPNRIATNLSNTVLTNDYIIWMDYSDVQTNQILVLPEQPIPYQTIIVRELGNDYGTFIQYIYNNQTNSYELLGDGDSVTIDWLGARTNWYWRN